MVANNMQADEQKQKRRNLIVLIGGMLILAAASGFLLFGQRILGQVQPDQPFTAEGPAAESAGVQLPTSGPPLQVGDEPIEFVLQGLDGQTFTLSQFIGRPILVNFWATWCGPCRLEMPKIQTAWQEHQDDGLVILALNQDETATDVRAYFDELGLTFSPLLDEGGHTARNFGLQGTLPASVFINPDGRVSVIHRGLMTRGQLDDFLAQSS